MFTGQQNVASIGLYFYNARWYDSALGRFVQADRIIPSPGLSVAWDRYAYVANNPVKYIDPSGHHYCDSAYADPEECTGLDADGDGYLDPRTPKPTYYGCTPSSNTPCLTQHTDPLTQLAHVIFGEGGSSLYQAGVNVTQTILNRAYNYWTCRNCLHSWINPGHIPWERITEEQLLALLLFIVSEPYLGSDGVLYPAYNAWGAPYPHPQTGEYGGEVFSAIVTMLGNILDNPGLTPSAAPVVLTVDGRSYRPPSAIQDNTAVMYYGAASNTAWGDSQPPGWVAFDAWTDGVIIYTQYY
jgi:RHS repeat-associated protein